MATTTSTAVSRITESSRPNRSAGWEVYERNCDRWSWSPEFELRTAEFESISSRVWRDRDLGALGELAV